MGNACVIHDFPTDSAFVGDIGNPSAFDFARDRLDGAREKVLHVNCEGLTGTIVDGNENRIRIKLQ